MSKFSNYTENNIIETTLRGAARSSALRGICKRTGQRDQGHARRRAKPGGQPEPRPDAGACHLKA